MAFSRDGALIAARDRDSSKVHIWFRESHQQMVQLAGGYETPSDLGSPSLAFSPDGNPVALSRDHVKIWDLQHWKTKIIDVPGYVTAVLPSADSLIVAAAKRTIRIDLSTGARSETLGWFMGSSLDGSRIATLGDDGLIRVFDAHTGKQLLVLDESWCPPVGLSANRRTGVANGKEAILRQFEVGSGESTVLGTFSGSLRERSLIAAGGYPNSPHTLALAPNRNRIATAINVAERRVDVELWELPSGTRHHLSSYDNCFVGACFSPTGKYLVVTPTYPEDRGGMVQVWDVQGSEPLRLSEFRGPDRLHRLRFAPNDAVFVVSGRAPGELILHDIARHGTVPLAGSAGAWVCSVTFSADARTLVTASPVGQVRFLRIPTGEELGTLNLDERVSVVELTHGDNTIITAGWDGVVRLWPIATTEKTP